MKFNLKIIFSVLVLMLCISSFAADYKIIVNKDVAIDEIDTNTLKNIFLGKTIKWDDGKLIIVSHPDKADYFKAFLDDIVKKSEKKFNTFWKKQMFTGTATAPKKLDKDAEIAKYVAENSGAVAVVKADFEASDVKVLNIK